MWRHLRAILCEILWFIINSSPIDIFQWNSTQVCFISRVNFEYNYRLRSRHYVRVRLRQHFKKAQKHFLTNLEHVSFTELIDLSFQNYTITVRARASFRARPLASKFHKCSKSLFYQFWARFIFTELILSINSSIIIAISSHGSLVIIFKNVIKCDMKICSGYNYRKNLFTGHFSI